MQRFWLGLVAVAIVGLFVTNSVMPSRWANEHVVSLTATHGIERRDVPALLFAVLGLVGTAALWRGVRRDQ